MATGSDEWFTDQSYWDTNRSFIWSDRLIKMSGFAASNIEKLLGMRKGESILDLACGFGRHSFEFHKLGFSVTGVDLNSRFIEEAKSKARETGESICFIHADMREFVEPEFEQLLKSSGFLDIQIYGSMKGTPYDEKAHFLVATACKSK